ncbi:MULTISPECIES: methyl-accepting chemotaxis protein [unclassified Lysobacter]|uniref:methyl-accepting chemotaxis protein n=1 Tax=unclassified Lysobacter TaxID=2635362 RepID=UPI001BE54427|nr:MULTISPECIES: methyl-accepting chemotaxis protein [unclassified Lysobacter]MBT2744822.1 methyl-accepting chemotaxis protein [Lysobacter sp. ISL-42]MBT2752185.1 methyl-accepting chemotaxis protein [Lysobacter sp. ISL-50]MBT2778682.1 methyl-accepting chemotaxis protein [Lysobacter sp. ISL-54]MBT2780387.1 methyl-accepting chemotaxis protein [Lysobacter sp. ISL-52]
MGIISNAGNAAKGVTDTLTDNVVGDAIDAVAGGLSGQSGGGASASAHYIAGEALDPRLAKAASIAAQPEPVGSDPGTQAKPGSHVPFDARKPLQFVHLSFAHDDHADRFPGESAAHGVAMRDALIREDVLIYSFARAAQRVLEQAKASKGAAGAMLDTAGSLLGGKAQASSGPEAIDPVLDAIRAAADPVNVEAPGYPEVHAAGVKLAEAWATLHETCKTALQPAAGGGLGLPSIPGLSSLAGGSGIPEVVAKIPEWLFKVQDAYQAMYRASRQAYEWDIIKACHDYSIQAIAQERKPGFDIWFLLGEKQGEPVGAASGVEQTLENAQRSLRGLPLIGGSAPVDDAAGGLGDVQKAIREAREGAREQAGDITGWLATAESEQANLPEGSAAALSAAIAALNGKPQAQPPLPALAPLMAQALGEALLGAGKPLPGFMQTGVGVIADIAMVLLPKVYSHLHGRLGLPDPALILAATHDAVAGKIVDLIWAWIFGKGSAPGGNDGADMKKRGTDLVDGLSHGSLASGGLPGVSALENKAADLVRGFIRDNGHYIDALIEFLAEDLHKELAAAQADCAGRSCLTMEAYLGRLPMLAALLMRNLTFPVFNLVLKIFGIGDQVAGMVWNPVDEKIRQAGQIARSVRDTKNDVRDAGNDIAAGSQRAEDEIGRQQRDITDKAGQLANPDASVSSLSDVQRLAGDKVGQGNDLADAVGGAPDDIMKAAKGEDEPGTTPPPPAPTGSGPISASRVRDGKAKPVAAGEIQQAGRVTVETEAEAIAARNQPAAAPPAAAAAPSLPF